MSLYDVHIFICFRNYEVAYGTIFDHKSQAAKKEKTKNTYIILKNLESYMRYLIKVRAFTIEAGPWTKLESFRTAMAGLFFFRAVISLSSWASVS